MTQVFEGEYLTKRDGGIKYTFAGGWQLEPEVRWKIKIWRGGKPAGDMTGALDGPPPLDVQSLLLGFIRKSIEFKIGVR